MRVLHLPTDIAGMPGMLARAERGLGLDSQALHTHASSRGYPHDLCLHLEELPGAVSRLARLAAFFLSARRRYDVFHFNFGASLVDPRRFGLHLLDLPFYGDRKLFATYNGCDARQRDATLARGGISSCADPGCYGGACARPGADAEKRRRIRKMAAHVRWIWALNPDLLWVLPPDKSSFLPYACDVEGISPAQPDFGRKRLTILHAPTDRGAKGSRYVLDGLRGAEQRHPGQVEVRLVENLTHQEAVRAYREADMVVDQVLSGWYGMFAVEAMLMGKPVICRLEKGDLRFIPEAMAKDLEEAMIPTAPELLADTISDCLENRERLRRVSQAGMEYARKWHDAGRVAGITRQTYENL